MKKAFWSFLIAIFLLTGCGPKLKVINHPNPNLPAADFTPFENAGCPANEYGEYTCVAESKFYAMGCDQIAPAAFFGALEPSLPGAVCYAVPYLRNSEQPEMPADNEFFFGVGGLWPKFIRYIVFIEGQYRIVRNPAELAEVFAPIESENEALAFALTAVSVEAYYGLVYDSRNKYEVDTLEDTHVEAIEGGYLIHAFDYQFFGCGPHYTYAVDVKVTTDGQVEIGDTTKLYRDPQGDELCVD